MTGTEFEIPIF